MKFTIFARPIMCWMFTIGLHSRVPPPPHSSLKINEKKKKSLLSTLIKSNSNGNRIRLRLCCTLYHLIYCIAKFKIDLKPWAYHRYIHVCYAYIIVLRYFIVARWGGARAVAPHVNYPSSWYDEIVYTWYRVSILQRIYHPYGDKKINYSKHRFL